MTRPAAPLRDRLLASARTLLDHEGLEAVTIREVARRTGVSHGAPRRHFSSRRLLLATLAGDGFDALASDVNAAIATADSPHLRLRSACAAYVRFASQAPPLFDLMFRHDLLVGSGAHLRTHSLPILGTLDDLLAEVTGRPTSPLETARVWTALHGLAVLTANRSIELVEAPDLGEQLLDVLTTYRTPPTMAPSDTSPARRNEEL